MKNKYCKLIRNIILFPFLVFCIYISEVLDWFLGDEGLPKIKSAIQYVCKEYIKKR